MNNATRYKIKEVLNVALVTVILCGFGAFVFFAILTGTMGILIGTGVVQ